MTYKQLRHKLGIDKTEMLSNADSFVLCKYEREWARTHPGWYEYAPRKDYAKMMKVIDSHPAPYVYLTGKPANGPWPFNDAPEVVDYTKDGKRIQRWGWSDDVTRIICQYKPCKTPRWAKNIKRFRDSRKVKGE